MGITLIKMRIMPLSAETDLENLKEIAQKIIESKKGSRVVFEEQPVAFGLKAVIASFQQDEEEGELEPIEEELNKNENISSVETIDMRRAFG